MQRFYSFKVVTYNSLDIVNSFISSTSHYAYALHNFDLKDDGTLQDEHYHILCTFSANKSFESVRKLMGGTQNTFVQPMTDKFGDYLYLTHKNAPDKYQYPDDIIVTNSKDFFTSATDKTISNDEFLNDISPYSMLSELDLARKYGRDYIKNCRAYREFAKNAFDEQFFIERGYSRDMCLISYDQFVFDIITSYLEPYYRKVLPYPLSQQLFGELPCSLSDAKTLSLCEYVQNYAVLPLKKTYSSLYARRADE